MFYGFVITEAGNNLLAKMVAGDKLTITKVVMDKGTAESAEDARKLTAPIDPGPNGTSTVPTVEGAAVNMLVEYRSDLNGGLQEGFWIGGFAVFGKVENGAETMIYYGSLGEQKQYVSAYVEGTAPDVRRYPVSITVTAGVEVEVSYPAEAWMTAEDVAEYFNQTLKPDLEESLDGLIQEHDKNPNAHNGALKDKQDAIKVEGLLKGTKTTGEGGDTYKVGAAKPGTDYQQPTNTLPAAEEMTTQDYIPFVNHETGQHMRATLQSLKEAIGVQSPTIKVTTCEGAAVTCSDGVTTLEGTGSTEFELPNVGDWTVTATLNEQTATQLVEVSGALLYEVDLMITEGIAVTTQPTKKSYYIGEAFDPAGMVVTATFADDTTEDVTDDCTFSPATISKDTTAITVNYQQGGIKKTASVAVTVRDNYRGAEVQRYSFRLLIPAYAFCVWLIAAYQVRAGDPVRLDYVYELFGIIASLLGLYCTASFSFERGRVFPTCLFSLLGIYFCLTTLADEHDLATVLLYGFAILYLVSSTVTLLYNAGRPELLARAENDTTEGTPDES